jgi:hypothetical protein
MNKQEFLQDLIDYYSEDTSRRAANSNGQCKYRDGKGRKCAIGRWISESKYSPEMESQFLIQIIYSLPDEIRSLGYGFLSECQDLHDNAVHWDDHKGISKRGKKMVQKLENKYEIKVDC